MRVLPIIDSDHVALTHGSKEALQPHSPIPDTFDGLKGPTTPLFKHRSGQLQPRVSGVTTTTIIIITIETGHTAAAQWPTCSPAPASTREWHFAPSPGSRAK